VIQENDADYGPENATPIQSFYMFLPSDNQLRDSPFQLSDPREYISTFQELSRLGYSNSSGFIAEKSSNHTFLLRIAQVDGELAVELIAVFEGDVLSPSS
jgi:hypothetical protein